MPFPSVHSPCDCVCVCVRVRFCLALNRYFHVAGCSHTSPMGKRPMWKTAHRKRPLVDSVCTRDRE